MQSDQNEFDAAEGHYQEALSVRRQLAEVNPQVYLPKVAETLINLSVFYQEDVEDKTRSLVLVTEAIQMLWPFREIGYVQGYLNSAFAVLEEWGVDKAAFLLDLGLEDE